MASTDKVRTACSLYGKTQATVFAESYGVAGGGSTSGVTLTGGTSAVTTSAAVAHGFTSLLGCSATLANTPTVASGTYATAVSSGTTGIILSVWRPTSSGDTTPSTSISARQVNWVAIGT